MRTQIELDELGKSCVGIVATLEVSISRPERMTRDYPGSPGLAYIDRCEVTQYRMLDATIFRDDRPDWFAWLDFIVAELVDEQQLYEDIFGLRR